MNEARLVEVLTRRFGRLVWVALAAYALVLVAVFAVLSEVSLRRSLDHAANEVQSLIRLYADPGGQRTAIAPPMLAEQFRGMAEPLFITRTAENGGASAIYFLSPTMPARQIETHPSGASAEEIRAQLMDAVTEHGSWRYRKLYRSAGEFEIVVTGSRGPYALALVALLAAAALLLPVAGFLTQGMTDRSVGAALVPLARMVAETQSMGPGDLSRRTTSPAGVAEITELADAQNRLLDRLERSRHALEAFTADASHELRTPLTHLRAQAQWALDERHSPEEMREALAGINREIEWMARMVEDLLLIAKGENRQLAMQRRAFDLSPTVREVEEIAVAMAAERDLRVVAEMNGSLQAYGDPGRTREILLNLAANAVRYTADGSVTLSGRRLPGMVGVAVSDTGCGIASEDLEHIFERFYRVERSRSRALGGAGLGLTIARLLAELQEGTITVESTPGAGSTFVLWLPATDDGH